MSFKKAVRKGAIISLMDAWKCERDYLQRFCKTLLPRQANMAIWAWVPEQKQNFERKKANCTFVRNKYNNWTRWVSVEQFFFSARRSGKPTTSKKHGFISRPLHIYTALVHTRWCNSLRSELNWYSSKWLCMSAAMNIKFSWPPHKHFKTTNPSNMWLWTTYNRQLWARKWIALEPPRLVWTRFEVKHLELFWNKITRDILHQILHKGKISHMMAVKAEKGLF